MGKRCCRHEIWDSGLYSGCIRVYGNKQNLKDYGSISFIITSDEEGKAINGTKKVVEWLINKSEKISGCIVGEPTNVNQMGDTIKIGRRGSFTGSLIVKGIQGHVGYPDLAENPINSLLKMLEPFTKIYLDKGTNEFQPSSVMITTIDVNNDASNVIPGEVKAKFNIRFNTLHSVASLKSMLKNQFDAITKNYEFDYFCNAEPFLTSDEELKSTLQNAIKKVVNVNPEKSTTGGTSDARFITKICPVIEFGLVGKTMHKIDENVEVDDIMKLTSIYNKFLIIISELKKMIKFPPNPFVIKDGFFSAFQFMSKKGNSSQLFNLNLNGFWDSCWIVFL